MYIHMLTLAELNTMIKTHFEVYYIDTYYVLIFFFLFVF